MNDMDYIARARARRGGGGGGGEAVLVNKTVSANGTYNASTDSADGYKKVTVNVPNTYAADDEGKVVSNGALVAQTSDTVTANDTYDTTLINSLTVAVPQPSLQWTLIGQKTIALEEYTGTTAQNTDTEIDLSQTDYACMLAVVTCDTPILTSTEWGMTVGLMGRYTSGSLNTGNVWFERGSATLSKAALVNNIVMGNSYGVYFQNAKPTIILQRQCHATYCPKIRAGNYTVKVYGLTAL